jgi:predicted amidohydrolase YtcJ
VHAIGDRCNHEVLEVFGRLGIAGTIEHAQLVDVRDMANFGRLGITASVQPEHAMDDRDIADRYWADRVGGAFAFRSLLDSGAMLQLGSDAPVAPLDPWIALSAGVFRSRDGREPWHPEQRIPLDAALAASTRTTVSVGQPADLAVLDADPRSCDAAGLRAMPVAATFVAGRMTWNALA